MRKGTGALAALALSLTASAAWADPIASGQTVSGIVVDGTSSIYHLFGHEDPGVGASTSAFLLTFAAGGGNVFTFSAGGAINCCGGDAVNGAWGPDGLDGGSTNVTGANGLSSLSGDSLIPLVGVFTSEVDPDGGAAPAALVFDKDGATGIDPLLNQVFYIGDGRAGFNNAGGGILQFLAPTGATRLYLGVIDAFGFNGATGYYHDNPGNFRVSATLNGVPEPSTWAMMIGGFCGVGAILRRRRVATATA